MLPKGSTVIYHSDLDFNPGKHDVIIVDEADLLIYDNNKVFKKLLGDRKCIAYTATC